MLENILNWERELFLTINQLHTPALDRLMPLYTDMWVWVPFFIIFLLGLMWGKPRREWLPVVVAFVAVVLAANFTTGILVKPFFQRLRPTYHPDFMNEVSTVLGYLGEGKYGFISGHSTFSFAVAMFTSLLLRYWPYGWMIFCWAFGIVYSRLYLGVHFLSDVIPGMIAGMLIGWMVYSLLLFCLQKKEPGPKSLSLCYPDSRKSVLTLILSSYILLVFLIGLLGIRI